MVKPKHTVDRHKAYREQFERFERENPIIDTRWYVIEVTPAYTEPGYYGMNIPEKHTIVSKYFSNEDDAQEFVDTHETDPGKTLKVVKQHKRRTVIEKWW